MNMRDISSDITPIKVSEVNSVETPKEIGEDKVKYTDTPKEIGEDKVKYADTPREIGEDKIKYADTPKEIGEDKVKYADTPKEIGENSANVHEISENNDIQKNYFIDPDGNKRFTDDNNKTYRINDDLVANNTYEINGYKYETDKEGRIVSAEGKLQLKDHDNYRKVKDPISKIGKGDEKETDDRGHVIGDQFNGSNGMENVVAQDSAFNKGEYKNFENNLAKEICAGKDVHIRIDLNYPGKSYRPDSFLVNYSINGEEFVKVFSNESKAIW